jgi:hypothetical protein
MFLSCIFLRLGRTAVVMLQELFMLSVSQEIYSRKIRRCIGRREWLDVQYPVLNLGLLVNIDLSRVLQSSGT